MADAERAPRALTLGRLLAQVSRLVGGRLRVKMEGIGIHHAQALVLFELWQDDGMAQNVLAQALGITPATATNTLQRMERDGWVERRRDATDQRVVRVHLTRKAATLRDEVRTSLRELDDEVASALSEGERTVLRELLLKVRRHLASQGGIVARPPEEAAEGRGREGPEAMP